MDTIGLICKDDVELVGHSLFNNYRKALANYFTESKFIDISNDNKIEKLKIINLLIIIDEHFEPHHKILKDDYFIDKINETDTQVLVINFEKIYNSAFPWNIDHQNKLETIKNLTQFISDVEDLKFKNSNFLTKQLLSRDTTLIENSNKKKDRIVFIGQSEGPQYNRRRDFLNSVNSKIPLDIITTGRKLTYEKFLQTLSEYNYVLNLLGCGDFVNLRFYEALELGCMPIQQITPIMQELYKKELEYSITFTNKEDILSLREFKRMNYYLEDYFEEINLKKILNF